jgi:hypothetical protein
VFLAALLPEEQRRPDSVVYRRVRFRPQSRQAQPQQDLAAFPMLDPESAHFG